MKVEPMKPLLDAIEILKKRFGSIQIFESGTSSNTYGHRSTFLMAKSVANIGSIETVDVNQNAVRECKRICGEMGIKNVRQSCMKGVTFLRRLKVEPLFMLGFLDAVNESENTLQEFCELFPRMYKSGIIVIDDAFSPVDKNVKKGPFVIRLLERKSIPYLLIPRASGNQVHMLQVEVKDIIEGGL